MSDKHPASLEVSKTLRFLVAGTGRSGSKWMAGVWSGMGFPCGHEHVFNPWLRSVPKVLVGDSSHQCAPFLKEVKEGNPDIVIFHQLRDPFDYVSSVYGESNFLTPSGHEKFMLEHIDMTADEEVTAAMQVWVKWNALIAPYADFAYRVEDVDQEMVNKMLGFLGEPSAVADFGVYRNVHRKQRLLGREAVIESPYYPDFKKAAKGYGYNV